MLRKFHSLGTFFGTRASAPLYRVLHAWPNVDGLQVFIGALSRIYHIICPFVYLSIVVPIVHRSIIVLRYIYIYRNRAARFSREQLEEWRSENMDYRTRITRGVSRTVYTNLQFSPGVVEDSLPAQKSSSSEWRIKHESATVPVISV